MRIVLYTGKGGVGKTSVAAATALRAAERGARTLVMSTDMAHSLADSFDVALGSTPVEVAPNLWGQEVDVYRELDAYWGIVKEWITALMHWQGVDEVVAEEMAILPGMEELVGLLYINRYARREEYDLLVVDCAPTGETLRLLSFPDMARWYMKKLFPIERRVASAIGPMARSFLKIPVPGDQVFASMQDLFGQLESMRTVLSNASVASIRLVVNPERMVIKEAQRTFTYLNLYGYHTDLIVCNRLLPPEASRGFFREWGEVQERHLQFILESFGPIPVRTVPLMEREVVGLELLRRVGQALFGEDDPGALFYAGQRPEVSEEDGAYVLTVPLPFVSAGDLSLIQNGEEMVVQVGRYRRNILLPHILVNLPVLEARLESETLKIRFARVRSGRRWQNRKEANHG